MALIGRSQLMNNAREMSQSFSNFDLDEGYQHKRCWKTLWSKSFYVESEKRHVTLRNFGSKPEERSEEYVGVFSGALVTITGTELLSSSLEAM